MGNKGDRVLKSRMLKKHERSVFEAARIRHNECSVDCASFDYGCEGQSTSEKTKHVTRKIDQLKVRDMIAWMFSGRSVECQFRANSESDFLCCSLL